MTDSESNNVEEIHGLKNVIECDVCFEIMKEPQALECLHHFCKTCINKLCKKTPCCETDVIQCPQCRKLTTPNEVQDSFIMNSLLEIYHKHINPTDDAESLGTIPKCLQCDRPDIAYRCTDCQMQLCRKCKRRHLRIPSCKDHNIVEISESKKKKVYKVEKATRMLGKKAKEQMKTIESIKQQIQKELSCVVKSQDNYQRNIMSQNNSTGRGMKRNSDGLVKDPQICYDAQVKRMGDLEHNLVRVESRQSWLQTTLNRTKCPFALCESLIQDVFTEIESWTNEFRNSNKFSPNILATQTCINIFVETLSGKNTCLQMSPYSTVLTLKQKVEGKHDIPWDRQRLVFRFTGKELEQDHLTLLDYDVHNDAVLTMKIKLKTPSEQ